MKERLIKFIEYKGLSRRAFELSCGIASGTVRNTSGNMTPKTLSKITAVYPELNQDWLLTGKGSMLIDNNLAEEPTAIYKTNKTTAMEQQNLVNALVESQKEIIALQKAEIERLKKEIEELKNTSLQGRREGLAS